MKARTQCLKNTEHKNWGDINSTNPAGTPLRNIPAHGLSKRKIVRRWYLFAGNHNCCLNSSRILTRNCKRKNAPLTDVVLEHSPLGSQWLQTEKWLKWPDIEFNLYRLAVNPPYVLPTCDLRFLFIFLVFPYIPLCYDKQFSCFFFTFSFVSDLCWRTIAHWSKRVDQTKKSDASCACGWHSHCIRQRWQPPYRLASH